MLKIKDLLDLNNTIAVHLFDDKTYPWEVLPEIGDFIIKLGEKLDLSTYDKIDNNIWKSKSATIADTAFISGPCIIGHNTEVRHCAFIRGNVIVGENCVVGNSTELKNSILFNYVQVPHFNYVGDSILGFKSHMGAGSITSNVKSNKSLVDIKINNEVIKTNRKKVGAILGDFVEVGCNSVLNPGTVIGRNTDIYPLSNVRGFINSNCIYKDKDNIISKI